MKVAPRVFDSHFHIIDPRFPLVSNQGYLPDPFSCDDYCERLAGFDLVGGAIVSGSFQGFDQTYLVSSLRQLGPSFVGVTQVPVTITDEELVSLDREGVRAVRFNLRRGGSDSVENLEIVANRIHDLLGWHVELYVDSICLGELCPVISGLPSASIDHLGLSSKGFEKVLELAERGVRIKATGFSRIDFPVVDALKQIYEVDPTALMFGTDLPSTRAPRPYTHEDMKLIIENFSVDEADNILCGNARSFYRKKTNGEQGVG